MKIALMMTYRAQLGKAVFLINQTTKTSREDDLLFTSDTIACKLAYLK